MTHTEDETKLLDILAQDETEEVDEAPIELDDEQRATLTKILQSQMLTPEEIAEIAKINEHNAAIEAKRQENLTRRAQRRVSRVKNNKR